VLMTGSGGWHGRKGIFEAHACMYDAVCACAVSCACLFDLIRTLKLMVCMACGWLRHGA
jgi:hypothetical protein